MTAIKIDTPDDVMYDLYQIMDDEITKSFTHTPVQSDAPQPMTGHGTSVRRRVATSGGDFVEKSVNPDGDLVTRPIVWVENALRARQIADQIRAKGNPHYNVPKTFIHHGKVYEQFAPGNTIRGLDWANMPQYKDVLIPAAAHFINDMSELRPMQQIGTGDIAPANRVPGIYISNDLVEIGRKTLTPADQDFVQQVFEYLRDLPENNEYVFSHGDLHPDNIIFDPKTNQVSFIDFELAGYESKFAVMYKQGLMGRADIWEYANKLPRTTNPDLRWNFDPDKFALRRFLSQVAFLLRKEMQKHDAQNLARLSTDLAAARLTFGRLKIKDKQARTMTATMALARADQFSHDI